MPTVVSGRDLRIVAVHGVGQLTLVLAGAVYHHLLGEDGVVSNVVSQFVLGPLAADLQMRQAVARWWVGQTPVDLEVHLHPAGGGDLMLTLRGEDDVIVRGNR